MVNSLNSAMLTPLFLLSRYEIFIFIQLINSNELILRLSQVKCNPFKLVDEQKAPHNDISNTEYPSIFHNHRKK